MTKLVAGFVRDMGAGNVVSPTLLALGRLGYTTQLFIERGGQALNRVAHPAQVISTLEEVQNFFSRHSIAAVVVGLSAPNRTLEAVFEQEARRRFVPVILAEDTLSASGHSALCADMVLAPDHLSATLARDANRAKRIEVVGLAGILPFHPKEEFVSWFERMRTKTGAKILYSGDCDPRDSEASMRLLCESIILTQGPVRLIHSPHPKFAKMPGRNGRTQGEMVREVLEPLARRGLLLECPPGADGDAAAMLSDAVCSAYSTLLMRAASAGKYALTLRTSESVAAFKHYTGLEKTWLEQLGFPIIDRPRGLDELLGQESCSLPVQAFEANLAARVIHSLIA